MKPLTQINNITNTCDKYREICTVNKNFINFVLYSGNIGSRNKYLCSFYTDFTLPT